MKRYSITEVSKVLGISKVANEAHDTGEPVYLEKDGKAFVVIMPCDERIVDFQNSVFTHGKVLGMLAQNGLDAQVEDMLVADMIKGANAEALLFHMGHADLIKTVKDNLVQRIIAALDQEVARQKNSSEDSAMVGTNTSADEAEADKQGKRSVVSPAKSVMDQQRGVFKKTFDKARKKPTSAKSEKSPPTGGKSSEGDTFEYRMKA